MGKVAVAKKDKNRTMTGSFGVENPEFIRSDQFFPAAPRQFLPVRLHKLYLRQRWPTFFSDVI